MVSLSVSVTRSLPVLRGNGSQRIGLPIKFKSMRKIFGMDMYSDANTIRRSPSQT